MNDRVGALYIRVSTNDQTELSPDAQKRILLDYAKKNGMILSRLVDTFSSRILYPMLLLSGNHSIAVV